MQPYKVQEEALKAANGRAGFAYFIEMGLGKTAITLAEIVSLHEQRLIKGAVVVCPNSLKGTWLREIEKVGAPIGYACAWPNEVYTDRGDPWLQIINYEAIITPRGYKFVEKLLCKFNSMLVLDESIHIKNHRAKRTRGLMLLGKDAKFRRILSGAPIVQGPHDLWAQLRFLGTLRDVNYYVFRNMFCVMGGWQGKQVVGSKNEEKLNGLIKQAGFRARKTDWLDLPDKTYITRDVVLSAAQLKHYKEMYEHFATMVTENEAVTAQMVLTQMQKLQQIGSGFLMSDDKVYTLGPENPRLEALKEVLDEIEGKAIVFTFYRHSTKMLHDEIEESACLMGGMPTEEVQSEVKRFNEDPACRVMIAQIQSAKYGHTLLGGKKPEDRCATTIFYENSFSLDNRMQAEDRNHRIGQDRMVVYVDLVATDVDKAAVEALQRKLDIASAIVDGIKARGK